MLYKMDIVDGKFEEEIWRNRKTKTEENGNPNPYLYLGLEREPSFTVERLGISHAKE
jgi:hypothetical protein